MARARECTRCQELYKDYHPSGQEGNHNGLLTIDRDLDNRYSTRQMIDLCPACKASFDEWLKIVNAQHEVAVKQGGSEVTTFFEAQDGRSELVVGVEESEMFIDLEEEETGWSIYFTLSKGQAKELAEKILGSI